MYVENLVIGSGCAGLAAALHLEERLPGSTLVVTEGLSRGTSINTGSDKQTYYKLGMYGDEPDSPMAMARDLSGGGAMHGDLALVEAALSPVAFARLIALGVAFPHDRYGQYIGYKTDHDSHRRATGVGPYTSRDMCRSMIAQLKKLSIPVLENMVAVELLTERIAGGGMRTTGAVFVDLSGTGETPFRVIQAENVILAAGGFGGFYADSVYPESQTGGIGLALVKGVLGRNLPESQFGTAAVKFRWNISGSYFQALPRFLSRAADGISDEHEFLTNDFQNFADPLGIVFRKGYQWPFSAGNLPGTSVIDILIAHERARGRRVFLDYRSNPSAWNFDRLPEEAREYLQKCGAAEAAAPFERLVLINRPAADLCRSHGVNLEEEPLEVAVCAQHNNGGLAGDLWWRSENCGGLFPVGEINGSHGVTRPGGSALNAGQTGALRAAEYIASQPRPERRPFDETLPLADYIRRQAQRSDTDWRRERRALQKRMSLCGGFLQSESEVKSALEEVAAERRAAAGRPLGGLTARALAETLRNESILAAEHLYLHAMLFMIRSGVGSRGGRAVTAPCGIGRRVCVRPELWIQEENPDFRNSVLESGFDPDGHPFSRWAAARQIPSDGSGGWFEPVWRSFREKRIYN